MHKLKRKKCYEIEKKFLECPEDQRAGLARDLLRESKALTSMAPDYFHGWFETAEAALSLGDSDSGTAAGASMIALGVVESRNMKVLGVMAALGKHGWLHTPIQNADSSGQNPVKSTMAPVSQDLSAQDRLEFDTLVLIA